MNAPLYFLPGWCLGRGPLETAVNALNGQFIDLPGYRGQAPISDFNEAADQIAQSLPDGAFLAGWSIGAQLALAIAARHPDKVARLLLVAGTASFVQRDTWPHAMPPAVLSEFTAAVAADAAGMLPRFVGGFNRGDDKAKDVSRQILELADPLPPADVLACGLRWLAEVDLQDSARQVSTPTLLIHGAADPLMPLAAAETLAGLMPQASLATMTGCAHAPFLSQPSAFLDLARDFLGRQQG